MDFRKIFSKLHNMPEISGQEKQTADFIADLLCRMGVNKIYRNIGYYSLLAIIEGDKPGANICFRCELDAIYNNNLTYHGCGHDGHITALLKLAKKLVNIKFNGKVGLLFQSAEENASGAKAVIESGIFEIFRPDYMFSFHNLPGYPLRVIVCKKGNFTTNVETLVFSFTEKIQHASKIIKNTNPIIQASELVMFCNGLSSNSNETFFKITPVQFLTDTCSFGTTPEKTKLAITLRAFETKVLENKKTAIINYAQNICKNVTYYSTDIFPIVYNNELCYNILIDSLRENFMEIIEVHEAFLWGEDFGYYTRIFPCLMFGIGNGISDFDLHSENYVFNENIIDTAVDVFWNIIQNIAKK